MIKVDTVAMEGHASALQTLAGRLDTVSGTLSRVNDLLCWDTNVSYAIRTAIINSASDVAALTSSTETMSAGLRSVSSWYALSEAKNSNDLREAARIVADAAADAASKVANGTGTDKKPDFKLWEMKDTWKVIGSFGIVGSAISTIGGVITGGVTKPKSWLGFGSGVAKTVELTAKSIPKEGNSFDWRTLFGINRRDGMTFAEGWKNQWAKYKFGDGATSADKVAVGAKWVGLGLTLVTTAYDNFTDTKENNSTGRKILETVGETTVKVIEGVALAALASTIGAPAVVGVGLTVLATWAIDKAFEYFTGKNAAECISDAVLDGVSFLADKAAGGLQTAASAVGNAVKGIGKSVSGWWKGAFA